MDSCGENRTPIEQNPPFLKKGECRTIGDPLYLHQIGARMTVSRLQQDMLDPRVIRQQQKSFAVGIKPSSGVNVRRKGAKLRQCTMSPRIGTGGELRKDAVRLVEQDDCRPGRTWHAPMYG